MGYFWREYEVNERLLDSDCQLSRSYRICEKIQSQFPDRLVYARNPASRGYHQDPRRLRVRKNHKDSKSQRIRIILPLSAISALRKPRIMQ